MTTKEKLINLMALRCKNIVDVIKTSDGFYLGMAEGDIGFNDFIGRPQAPHDGPGRDNMLKVWGGFTDQERQDVVDLAEGKGIDLESEFGIPVSEMLAA